MWKKTDRYVKETKMIEEGDSILMGISGGADSICLARYLLYLKKEKSLTLYAVHVNHLLRQSEAERDQHFVEEFCFQWQIPLKVYREDVRRIGKETRCSEEEAGRQVRYRCFEEEAKTHGCNKIAVAHHENDLAETILFRMARGTGLKGLLGIPPINGKIIRPLLCLNREEILRNLERLSQDYVTDSSNGSEDYSRNFIRHRILPELEQLNEGAVAHIGRLSVQTGELLDYLKPKLQALYETVVCEEKEGLFFSEEAYQKLHPFEQKEILRRMLFETAGKQKDISYIHIQQLQELMKKRVGKHQDLPYGVCGRKMDTGIWLFRRKEYVSLSDNDKRRKDHENTEKENNRKNIKIEAGEDSENSRSKTKCFLKIDKKRLEEGKKVFYFWGEKRILFQIEEYHGDEIIKRDCVKCFDYDRIKNELCLRTRCPGDYFIMDKKGRHKALQRYFIDTKIPAKERDSILLLAEKEHILWIIGGRISEAYKVQRATTRILTVAMDTVNKN